MLDLWLAKDNRFLNPKSSYERILLAPPCRLINNTHEPSFLETLRTVREVKMEKETDQQWFDSEETDARITSRRLLVYQLAAKGERKSTMV